MKEKKIQLRYIVGHERSHGTLEKLSIKINGYGSRSYK